MNVSVVIPAYKNTEELVKNIEHNQPFLKDCEIIIVNDFPEKSISEDLKKFNNITLYENDVNMGFGMTVNVGVHHASHPYVMLLNSDVLLNDTSYTKSIEQFSKDKQLFAVSFAQKEQDGTIVGNNRIYWKDGFMYHNRNPKNENGINGWAEGGSCMIDREKFLDLHGFDQLYAPFYWEDIDLSYRAWKSGYDVLFNADILVEHHHQSTIGKYFDSKKVTSVTFRNQLLFIWKNINTGSLLSKHIGSLCILLAKQLLKGDTVYLAATFQALMRLPAALSSRSSYRISDTEIFNKFI